MDILSVLLAHNTILAGILLFILGLWTYFHRREKPVYQTFAALLISSALWLFTLVLWKGAADIRQQEFWIRTLFFSGSFLPLFFLLFTLAFIGRFPRTLIQGLFILPSVGLYVVAYGTDLLVSVGSSGVEIEVVGRAIFAGHFAVAISVALGAILRELQGDPAFDKTKLPPLLAGATVSFLAIFVTLFASDASRGAMMSRAYEALAVFALAGGMLAIAWMVDSKKLLSDLRPVGGELFILIVIFLISMDIAVARSPIDLSVRLVVLVILAIYGAVSVRSAAREIKRLREISGLHDQLVMVNGRLLEADKAKTRLVSFATHELRSPIAGIRGYLDMLSKGEVGEVSHKQSGKLNEAVALAARLNETIETFLDVSKIELGADEPFHIETDLVDLLKKVAKEQRPAAEAKRIGISVAVPVGLPSVMCDAGKIYHAVANLVQNAIKYTQTGGVTISAGVEGNWLVIKVADSGIGLDEKEKADIREVLKGELQTVKFEASGGSGLGMFIVKSIVKAHGGEMSVESPGKGHGSTFSIRIPIS